MANIQYLWKRMIFVILVISALFAVFLLPAEAQETHEVFLPVVVTTNDLQPPDPAIWNCIQTNIDRGETGSGSTWVWYEYQCNRDQRVQQYFEIVEPVPCTALGWNECYATYWLWRNSTLRRTQ